MKDELLKQLIDIIQNTKDFTIEQMPLVANEIVRYGIVDGVIGIVFSICLILACLYTLNKKYKVDSYGDESGFVFFAKIVSIIFLIISVFMIFLGSSQIIKAKIAPRLFIIDELKGGGCKK